ncbi:putative BOI-related E3 ubiquitin-protein ligase [Forsythia ovata]|uniref:BOI-related E3 ubiquitin-protein ligase n=1 Tax=Forsythia ovata TaxID=205694 RepID=A0ABD1R9D5_9LAMI
MAVEARNLNLFPPQILRNREITMDGFGSNGNTYSTPIGYGLVAPLSGTTTATETVVPVYGSLIFESVPPNSATMKSIPVSRKRSRDVLHSSFPSVAQNQNQNSSCASSTFLGEDISFQIQQQSLEIDRLISQHTEKVRVGVEERRKRHSLRIVKAVEEEIMKTLKSKEEEIEKIGKLNLALEEKVKSLCVENQIWRDLAQTNEATANALRCNLEQVLNQVQDDHHRHEEAAAEASDLIGDAQSCCGSNLEAIDGERMCRNCRKGESSVLILPCRHLCLCTNCGSSLHTCPICNSFKTASVHVNMYDDHL